MNLCKNCRWYKKSLWSGKECRHPKSSRIDVVTGFQDWRSCRTMRWDDCGQQGVLWEPLLKEEQG